MKLSRFTNRRGNILLLTVLLVLPFLLIFAGLASDMAYYGNVDAELQRAMDGAALAGAGNLGFAIGTLPDARNAAVTFASLNPYHGDPSIGGTITLDPNAANDDSELPPGSTSGGKVVLGIWDPTARTFTRCPGDCTPGTEGDFVNAVKTKFATTIRPSFLGVLGVTSLSPAAVAIAWAPPPRSRQTVRCPIALTWDVSLPRQRPGRGGSLR